MECALWGAHWAGEVLFRVYFDHSGDRASVELIRFYRCGRALLRARLAITHIEEPNVRDPGKWRRQALGYLDLAFADAAALSPDR
jgi:aminoglycoside phosphotransferase family enzyme